AISQAALNVERRRGMPFSISTLLIRNLRDVFDENDPARRRAAIDEIWTEEGMFYDPKSGVHRGRDEIDRVAGAIKATHPDFQYQPIAEPEELGNGGRLQWVSGRHAGFPRHHAQTGRPAAELGRSAKGIVIWPITDRSSSPGQPVNSGRLGERCAACSSIAGFQFAPWCAAKTTGRQLYGPSGR